MADTDPSSSLGNTATFVPGSYDFYVRAPGYGLVRFSRTLDAGASTLTISLPTNWASSASDASAAGDGVNLGKLIDDDEGTNWASLGGAVAGKQVTVTLAGRHVITAARVSAMTHPSTCDGVAEEQGRCVLGSGSPDDTGQNRFTALRSFTIQACDASVKNCSLAKNWVTAYDSAADAFPSVRPRPVAPDLTLRQFDVKDVPATMVRLVVKANQCIGAPDFQGDQDADPSNNSSCPSSANATKVRAAELQVVSAAATVAASAGTTAAPTAVANGSSAGSGPAPSVSVVGRSVAAGSAPVASGVKAAEIARTAARLLSVTGRGAILARKATARATFAVRATASGGLLRYRDASQSLSLQRSQIRTLFVDYRRHVARITGSARVGGKPVRFAVQLTDRGRRDAFAIRLSNGYRLGGPLVSGSIAIA